MNARAMYLPGMLVLVFAVGCLWFDAVDKEGKVTEEGVFTKGKKAAEVASATGVPFAGIAGGVLGIIGAVGAWFKNNENKRNLRGMVALIEKVKPEVKGLANDAELEALVIKATDGTKFGRALKRTHAALKKI